MASKYVGDAIIGVGLSVLAPKPLDDRTVVANLTLLYATNPNYAYVGMTVANLDNGNIYMLTDKSKINNKYGWKASYESILIQTCTEAEYKEWLTNTDDDFNPVDETKSYVHLDTYYYIWEDSLTAETEMQLYLKASWGKSIEDLLATKASQSSIVTINTNLTALLTLLTESYATLEHLAANYVPLSFIEGTEGGLTALLNDYYTKTEVDDTFVTKEMLGGSEGEEGDYIFVTNTQYQSDKEDLEEALEDGLATKVDIDSEASLKSLDVEEEVSADTINATTSVTTPKIINGSDVAELKEGKMAINNKEVAFLEDIVPTIVMSRLEYDAMDPEDRDENAYYYLYNTDDEDALVKASLLNNYYTKALIDSKLVIISQLSNQLRLLSNRLAAIEATLYETEEATADTIAVQFNGDDSGTTTTKSASELLTELNNE